MEECQLDVKNNEQGAVEMLDFQGEMVLTNMESLLQEMSALDFGSSEKITISLKKVVDIDLSFLQLLKSFLLVLETKQLSVYIEWPEDESLMGLLERSGFKNVFKLN